MIDTYRSPRSAARRPCSSSAGSGSRSSASGIGSGAAAPAPRAVRARRRGRPPGRRRLRLEHLHGRAGTVELRLLLLAQAVVGDRRDRPRELPRRRERRAGHVGGRRARRSARAPAAARRRPPAPRTAAAAQAEPLDQTVHVEVGAHRVDRAGAERYSFRNIADPLPRLGRDLRGLRRRRQRRDHVELAPARDLGAAGDVDRSQLDRRARERAHDGRGVARVGEQSQPGEQVADLGPLEERGLADQPVRDRPFLQRDRRRRAPPARSQARARRSRPARRPRARSAARCRRRRPGPARVRRRSARSGSHPRPAWPRAPVRRRRRRGAVAGSRRRRARPPSAARIRSPGNAAIRAA